MDGGMWPGGQSDFPPLGNSEIANNQAAVSSTSGHQSVSTATTATTSQPIAITNVPAKQEQQQQQQQQQQGDDNDEDNTDSTYHLKWVPWNSGMIPIVMQSINGPCPLIATMNVLLLREKIKLPNMLEQITESQLLAYIGESIIYSTQPAEAENDEDIQLNLQQNINDAIEILPKLKTGLDVNIRFTGITDFEYTPECIIFDLLRIPLYHGWLSDPELVELQSAIGSQSYNQLVDNIITNKATRDGEMETKIMIAEEFLDRTASQLTLHGLNELRRRIKDNEIGILFRNNHFLTLFKREDEIYTLVTDHGYLTEDNIVWETLDNIEGAGRFFDSNFQPSEITSRQVSEMNAIDERQQQMVNDYLVALSLNNEENKQQQQQQQQVEVEQNFSQRELDDLEVAKKLQEEENRYYAEMISKKQIVPLMPKITTTTTTTGDKQERVQTNEWRPGGNPTTSGSSSLLASAASRALAESEQLRQAEVVHSLEPERSSSSMDLHQRASQAPPSDAKRILNIADDNATTSSHHNLVQNDHQIPTPSPGTSGGLPSATNNYDPIDDDASRPADTLENVPNRAVSSGAASQEHRQVTSSSSSSSTNRRSKSERSSKESNCIVH